MESKLIITVATTGGHHGKDVNPNLPLTSEEIAQAAYDAWNAGASVIHVHGRDEHGKHTANPAVYARSMELIRARTDLIVQFTTGAPPAPPGTGLSDDERLGVLVAGPEMAVIDMGTMQSRDGTRLFENSTPTVQRMAREMLERDIKPEIEIYSHSQLEDLYELIDLGLLKPPYWVDFVMGMRHRFQGALHATPKNLISLMEFLPPNSLFNASAIAAGQLPITTLSILLGGHARVGLEDNVYYRRGELAQSNAQLVERTARLSRELGREVATPSEARAMLGLKPLAAAEPALATTA